MSRFPGVFLLAPQICPAGCVDDLETMIASSCIHEATIYMYKLTIYNHDPNSVCLHMIHKQYSFMFSNNRIYK